MENRYSGDVFGKNVADSTRNDGDLAAHYPYSQERWRFFETNLDEANRLFLEYTEDGRYQHPSFGAGASNGGTQDVHTISPNAGDTLYFKTAERFRYVVGYESRATWAFSINQALQSGDEILIGPASNFGGTTLQNGYVVRFNSTLGPDKCEFVLLRDGTEQNSKTLNLSTPITEFQRLEWRYAWYNIMGCILSQSYEFMNVQLGTLKSGADQRGPSIGNLNIVCKITAGGSTTGLQVQLGSAAWQTWGDVDVLARNKTFPYTVSYGGSGDYEPLLVIRKDPKREYIKGEFDQVQVNSFNGNDDFFVLAVIFSSQNVRDSGGNLLVDGDFSVVNEISTTNSIFEVTENAAQFADSTGTLQTSAADPGGYQVGYAALYEGQGAQKPESTPRIIKRAVNNGDYIVILGRTDGATPGDAQIEIVTEQDW